MQKSGSRFPLHVLAVDVDVVVAVDIDVVVVLLLAVLTVLVLLDVDVVHALHSAGHVSRVTGPKVSASHNLQFALRHSSGSCTPLQVGGSHVSHKLGQSSRTYGPTNSITDAILISV